MQLSKEKTIVVDGVDRPRENWKGEPLAQNDEDLTKFWKWFGGSKFVDDKGRPMPADAWMERQEQDLEFDADVFKPKAIKITAFDLDSANATAALSMLDKAETPMAKSKPGPK
jgi:hypothetical protein